jgi:membrane protease YdiL (CAAX protease family)
VSTESASYRIRSAPNSQLTSSGLFFRWLLFTVGLFCAFGIPSIPLPHPAFAAMAELTNLSGMELWEATGILRPMLGLTLLVGVVRFLEKRSLSSIGIHRPSWRDAGAIVLVVASVSPLTGVSQFVLSIIGIGDAANRAAAAGNARVALDPIWFQAPSVVLYAMLEEIACRSYTIERLTEFTGSLTLASIANLILELLAHIPFWGIAYLWVVAPLQCIFILLYLWRRNSVTSAIAHLLIDSWALWL